MKLTYWLADCLNDSDVFSIRERTKKAAVAKLAEYEPGWFGPVRKVTVEYDDGFDLMHECSCENRHWWESTDRTY